MVFRYTVPASEEGRALKSVLRESLRLSAAQIRRLKAADALSVNGERSFPDRLLRQGDVLVMDMTEPEPSFPPEEGPLAILCNQAFCLVEEMRRGGGRGHGEGSL